MLKSTLQDRIKVLVQ